MGRILLVLAVCCAAASGGAAGAAAADDPTRASTSATARADAIRSIPLRELDAASRAKVNEIVGRSSIFRRMPVSAVDCDPDLYLFLVRNPEVIVNIWQVMNVTTVNTQRVKPGVYRATDGAGTACNIQFVHSSADTQVIVADGAYSGPLFLRPVKARCVLVLKSGYAKDADGQVRVTSRMDCFIDLGGGGVALLAKTVQPLVGRAADHNFTETSAFLGTLCRAAERNPPGMERLAAKLKIEAAVRNEFLNHTRRVAGLTDDESVVVTDQTPKGRPIPASTATKDAPPSLK